MSVLPTFLKDLVHAPAVLVSVEKTRGSAPREAGAWMAVFEGYTLGTVGGGRMELEAIAHARTLLQGVLATAPQSRRYALGPALGQCCGGEVVLQFETVTSANVSQLAKRLRGHRLPLAVFGGGHVGQAVVRACLPLPFDITWVDSRDDVFTLAEADNLHCEHFIPVHAAVPGLAANSRVLIMSFSHAEDLDVTVACLARIRQTDDLPFVGLIGSTTKWASFQSRLRQRGFTPHETGRITCPIGLPDIKGKSPEVIALSVAAQLLQGRPA